jgi:hypothetical protein
MRERKIRSLMEMMRKGEMEEDQVLIREEIRMGMGMAGIIRGKRGLEIKTIRKVQAREMTKRTTHLLKNE